MTFLRSLDEAPPKPSGLTPGKESAARAYYRHVKTGDRAFLVEVNGVPMVRLDRPNEDVVRKFIPEEWVPDDETRPITRAQIAMCIKDFDQRLCHFLGHTALAKQGWQDMSEAERVRWISGAGPKSPPIRQMVYRSIWNLLKGYSRDG